MYMYIFTYAHSERHYPLVTVWADRWRWYLRHCFVAVARVVRGTSCLHHAPVTHITFVSFLCCMHFSPTFHYDMVLDFWKQHPCIYIFIIFILVFLSVVFMFVDLATWLHDIFNSFIYSKNSKVVLTFSSSRLFRDIKHWHNLKSYILIIHVIQQVLVIMSQKMTRCATRSRSGKMRNHSN